MTATQQQLPLIAYAQPAAERNASLSGPKQSWRDRITVHPAAKLFPRMSDDELNELAEDIKKNELLHGVVVWTPERRSFGRRGLKDPKEIYLLDGRNRLEAIERAHTDPDERAEAIEIALNWRDGSTGRASLLYAEDGVEPVDYVISANIRRRHSSNEKNDEILAELIKSKPQRSDRQIAKLAGVSHPKIAKVRRRLEEAGDVEKISTRIDTTGRQQPARKLPPSREMAREKPEQIRAEAPHEVDALATIDHLADRKDAIRVLEDVTQFMSQHRSEVLALPRSVRLAQAMALLDALGLSIDDLVPAWRRQ